MENNESGTTLLGLTGGLWLMQKFFTLAQVMTLAHLASVATIFSGMAAGTYWLYSLYKKYKKDDRDPEEIDKA
jgi:hypothetical protein